MEAVFNFSHTNLTQYFVWEFSKNELDFEFFSCKNIPTSSTYEKKNRFNEFT
jgi:hypothetical protein